MSHSKGMGPPPCGSPVLYPDKVIGPGRLSRKDPRQQTLPGPLDFLIGREVSIKLPPVEKPMTEDEATAAIKEFERAWPQLGRIKVWRNGIDRPYDWELER